MEQAEQQIAQLKIDTKEKFFYTDRKRRNVNDELMGISNFMQMADSLRAINNSCIWNVLHAKTRIHVIKTLCQAPLEGYWLGAGNNYERLVLNCLESIDDNSQQDSILNSLRENNNEFLKLLCSKMDGGNLASFINTITGWLVSRSTNRPTYSSIKNQAFLSQQGNGNPTPAPFFQIYKVYSPMQAYDFTCGGEFSQENSVQLDISYDNDAGNPPGATFGTLTVDAYDWVALEMMEDIPGVGLKSGQGLVVPGIWAYWLFNWMNSTDAALTEPEVQLVSQVVLFLATDGITSILEGAFVAEAGQVAVLEARIVGQDVRAVVVDETVETPIVLEMEADANGVFTYNKLKWEQGYQADAQLVGKMPNPKFKSQGGEVVQRELLVVRTSAGICVRDATAVVGNNSLYSTSDALALTYDAGNSVNQVLRTQIFQLYNQRNWSALETLFKNNNLNGGYPPAYGGYNIVDNVVLKAGMKFDRYGSAIGNYNGQGIPNLGGNFTSPILNGNSYSFEQRALKQAESEYDFYYEIEVINNLPFNGQTGDVIPWFNHIGGGKQTMWEIPIDPATGFQKTWNKLAQEGYVKITIKNSPSGKFNYLSGTVIQ